MAGLVFGFYLERLPLGSLSGALEAPPPPFSGALLPLRMGYSNCKKEREREKSETERGNVLYAGLGNGKRSASLRPSRLSLARGPSCFEIHPTRAELREKVIHNLQQQCGGKGALVMVEAVVVAENDTSDIFSLFSIRRLCNLSSTIISTCSI